MYFLLGFAVVTLMIKWCEPFVSDPESKYVELPLRYGVFIDDSSVRVCSESLSIA